MVLSDLPSGTLRALSVPFGLLWGSFLNVVIYRVPRDMSVVRPGSHCPGCGKPIAAYDNIPVLSYLILRGKARCCGARMSPRYPIVEVLGGVLSWACMDFLLHHAPPDFGLARAMGNYLAMFALSMALTAAAFIDWEHMYLPDSITIGGTVLAFVTIPLRGVELVPSLLGAVIGFVVVWLPFIFLYKRVRGFAGMGMGDAKLVMLAGAWFGWIGAGWVLLAGSLQGSLGALFIYLAKGKFEEPESVLADRAELKKAAAEGDEEAKQLLEEDPGGADDEEGAAAPPRIAFGPFLILATLEYLFFNDAIYGVINQYMFAGG
jgi:leader peptidase (prepilin peptidase)/N-methyltransferase